MGWIIGFFVLLVLSVIVFCVWYMRKDIESALDLMAAFWIKRIKAKVAKIIGKGDAIEEGAKDKALNALTNLKASMDDEFDHLISWVANLNVIKKE